MEIDVFALLNDNPILLIVTVIGLEYGFRAGMAVGKTLGGLNMPNEYGCFATGLTRASIDQAINWVKAQQSMTPDKPFFVYYATGAVHAPHHVSKEWADKYRGQFDKGWDQTRRETTDRQLEQGILPANTKLADEPEDIEDWDSLLADHWRLFARQAEVFAGFMEQTDHEVGRFVAALKDLGELDNTLYIYIYIYIAGDNGTSAEGFVGMYNEMTYFNQVTEKVEDLLPLIDKWGGPYTFPHMAAGWVVGFDAPFFSTKQVASDFGGTRNGMVIHWPNGIEGKGGLRSQFSHVIDIAPTILEAAGLPEPTSVNGTPQTPIEGTSLNYSFNDAGAEERHRTRYFEYVREPGRLSGWPARPNAPLGSLADRQAGAAGVRYLGDLYNVREDFSLTRNLADEQPEKLRELQALFMKEAEKYHALPIDDRTVERVNAAITGRPDILGDCMSLTLYDGGGLGKGGKATLSVNGKAVADGRIEKTQPLIFSADETADVGLDNQTPVAEAIDIGRDETRFTGKLHKVAVEVKDVK